MREGVFSRAFNVFTVIYVALLLICQPFSNASEQPNGVNVDAVVAALDKMPAWTDPKSNPEAILAAAQTLASFNTAALREGMQRFIDKRNKAGTYDLGAMSKLFILNRVLVAASEHESEDLVFFGAWDGVPFT